MATKIPNEMQEIYDKISSLIKEFCTNKLNDEYEALCMRALEKLCRKRPSPLLGGRINTWAASIVYAICTNNFIFDKSQPIHMTATELTSPFGLAPSTVGNKAAEIKKILKIHQFSAEWSLPSEVDKSMSFWLVSVNGYVVDARDIPLPLQIECHKRGLIPYVPGLKERENDNSDIKVLKSSAQRVKGKKKSVKKDDNPSLRCLPGFENNNPDNNESN